MTAARLRTLGDIACVGTGGDELLQRQHRPLILLTYLAHCGPQDRRTLATVFWPWAKNPLNSLSSTLTRIRQVDQSLIDVDSQRVWTSCETDALRLIHHQRVGESERALKEYTGTFLDGFRLPNLGLELEEWIFQTREKVDRAAAAAAIASARVAAADGREAVAADLAEQAFTVTGLVGPVLEHADFLHGLLRSQGRVVADHLLEVAAEIGQEIATTAPTVGAAPLAGDGSDPDGTPWVSSLVGRDEERLNLADVMATTQLVNLFGLGGVGKSALARDYLESQADGMTRVHRVALNAEADGERLLEAVALAMDVTPVSGSTADALAAEVVDPITLIVDDVAKSSSVEEALAQLGAIDAISCVVLSRIRLDVPGARHMKLSGLSTAPGVSTAHQSPMDAESLSDAARLFVDRTGQKLSEMQASAAMIEDVCSRLSGVPLAIELTAAWLQVLPIEEVTALFDDEEILHHVPPGEDESLGRVIQRCWDLLDARSQQALSDLSVMAGDFTRASARAVTGVEVGELSRLIEASLIEVSPHSRMRCHSLVQDFAARQLQERPRRRAELLAQYRRWYLDLLINAVESLTGADQGEAIDRLALDHRNVEAAWNLTVEARDWALVSEAVSALDTYLLRSGQLFVARRLFEDARNALVAPDANDPDTDGLAALLTNNLAWVLMLIGRGELATELCNSGIDLVPAADLRTHIALLRTRSALASNSGLCREALDGYLAAQPIAAELDDQRLMALLEEDTGRCHRLLGNYDRATVAFRKTLDSARRFDDHHMESRSYLLLGATEGSRDPGQALTLLDEGEGIANRHRLAHLHSYFPRERAYALLALNDTAAAIGEFRRGMDLTDDVGDGFALADATIGLGRALLRIDDIDGARQAFSDGFRLCIRSNAWPWVLGAALAVANHTLDRHLVNGDPGSESPAREAALQLHAFARDHHALYHEDVVRELSQPRPAPQVPLPADIRLDETSERTLRLLRSAT